MLRGWLKVDVALDGALLIGRSADSVLSIQYSRTIILLLLGEKAGMRAIVKLILA